MRTSTLAVTSAALVVAGAVAADDPKDVKPLVELFLKAAGGAERLAQPPAYAYEFKRTTKVPGKPDVVVPGKEYIQAPDKMRIEEEIQRDGKPVKYVQVRNGNKRWSSTDGERRDLPQSPFGRQSNALPTPHYSYILLLQDASYSSAKLGESQLNGRPVEGIQLTNTAARSRTGRSAERLFFDKLSGLLVMRESGDPFKKGSYTECAYEDYRKIDGIAVPHKVTRTSVGVAPAGRDQVTYETVYSNFRFVDEFDPKLFETP